MAYNDYNTDPMGSYTGYPVSPEEVDLLASEEERKRKEEEERKRKEAEDRARKEADRIAKERDNLAVHKQEVTTYANGSKTITNVAEVPAGAPAPGATPQRPRPQRPEDVRNAYQNFSAGQDYIKANGQPQTRTAINPETGETYQQLVEEPKRREPGFIERAVNAVIPSAQAAPVPGAQSNVGIKPPPQRPVTPDEIFNRQLEAESGNRQFNADGSIVTSPKGAQGIAQIMPATARNPGYGIKPATPEEIATPEGNLAFGRRYKEGMLNLFNGDEEKATASYNAGPGRVQQAVRMAEERGGNWKDYLPDETKNYLQKVFAGQQPQRNAGAGRGFVNPPRVVPVEPERSLVAGEEVVNVPEGQQIPTVDLTQGQPPKAPVSPYDLSTGQPSIGLKAPGTSTGVESSRTGIDLYQANQDNPQELFKLGYSEDPNIPTWIKDRARNRAADLVTNDREMARAKETIANASETDIAKYLRKKSEGGSYLKLFLYGLFGMEKSGMAEAAKLGIGTDSAVVGSDGKPYLIKMAANGTPLEGYSEETGKKLTASELVKVAAGATDMKNTKAHMMAEAKGVPVTKTINGKLVNGIQVYDPVRKTFVVKYGNKTDEQPEGWTPPSQNPEQQQTLLRNKLMEQLRFVAINERVKKAAQFDQETGSSTGEQLRREYPEFFGGQATGGQPAGGQPSGGTQQPGAGGQPSGGGQQPAGGTQQPAAGGQPAGEAPSPYSKLPPAPKFQKDPGFENESPSAFKERQEAWSKTYGKAYQQQQDNSKKARDIAPFVGKMKDLIDKGTGSGIGAIVDDVGEWTGIYTTPGSIAIAEIAPLADKILKVVERFEGPQSDKDVDAYKRAAGDLANPKISPMKKQAAFNTILEILQRNAPEVNWGKELGAKKKSESDAGPKEGQTSTSKSGKPIVYRNGRWEYR